MSRGRVFVFGRNDDLPPSVRYRFDATSRSPQRWMRHLHPTHLGPVDIQVGGRRVAAHHLQNAWTFTAVYAPQRQWTAEHHDRWCAQGCAATHAIRHPWGGLTDPEAYRVGAATLDPISARWLFLCPTYAAAVEASPRARAALQYLHTLLDQGHDVALHDPDAYNHVYNGLSWPQVLQNSARPTFSHAFICAMLLERCRPWEALPLTARTPGHAYRIGVSRWVLAEEARKCGRRAARQPPCLPFCDPDHRRQVCDRAGCLCAPPFGGGGGGGLPGDVALSSTAADPAAAPTSRGAPAGPAPGPAGRGAWAPVRGARARTAGPVVTVSLVSAGPRR